MRPMTFPWTPELAAVDEKRRRATKTALIVCDGNVTAAAKELGVARSHLNKMLVRFELVEYARELRATAGLPPVGRPRKRG